MLKPAIAGGKSIRKDFLVFGKPKITSAEVREVLDTIRSGWLGTGPKTKKFEEDFRRYAHAKYAIALNSCTAGLHLALDVLGLKDGDEVITTPLTFASTANVIVHHHARPIFADVNKLDWNIDPQEIEKKITAKTRAIIPVDLHDWMKSNAWLVNTNCIWSRTRLMQPRPFIMEKKWGQFQTSPLFLFTSPKIS